MMKKILIILMTMLISSCTSPTNSVHFISYGDSNFKKSCQRIETEAKNTQLFSSITILTPQLIPEFFEKHKHFISNHARGGGYWIWKPYIILQALKKLCHGEYLVYTDAGCTILKNGKKHLKYYLNLLETHPHDILCFQQNFIEKEWTKGDLVNFFGIKFNNEIMNSGQILSGAIIIKKSPTSVAFINKWLQISISNNYHLIDDSPSLLPNDPTFKEHRHDQSIFSLLAKTEGAIILPDEVQFKKRNKKGKRDKKHPFPISATRKKE